MASAKESPRQKMINLMYMVFIAMLAMQMDKKVLSSFGFMKEKTEDANAFSEKSIDGSLKGLASAASEQPAKYGKFYEEAKKIHQLSDDFYNYIGGIIEQVYEGEDEEFIKNYEAQKGADRVDEIFFGGDAYTEEGQKFFDGINNYRTKILKILGSKGIKDKVDFKDLETKIKKRFNTDADKTEDGAEVDWLRSRYEGMPMITSVANFTQIQADIRTTEKELYNAFSLGQAKADASMSNYNGIVSLDKTAFYPGEKVTGKIVLGRYDASLKPTKVVYNGAAYNKIKNGSVVIDEVATTVGDKPIEGKITFMEEGKPVEIPFKSRYSVIPKPNGAVISADKMNVVYRGLKNPLTISVPGIPGNKVNASAPGLRRVSGNSYVMDPRTSGKTVKINVQGDLGGGKKVTDSKTFRVKDIPPGVTMVRGGQYGNIGMPKSSIQQLTVQAGLPDFLFDLKFSVSSFKVKVTGQPTVVVSGSRMNARAKQAISKARRNQEITIYDVKASVIGAPGAKVRKVLPLVIKVK